MANYQDYSNLAEELKRYSYERKGEIARLTYRAALAIDTMVARLKELERERDDGK